MSIRPPGLRADTLKNRLWPHDRGYWVLAFAVSVSLLAAEYLGPVIAIAIGIFTISVAALAVHGRGVPRVPSAGYWLVAIFVVGLASSVCANAIGGTVEGINLQRDIGIIVSYTLLLIGGYYFAYERPGLRVGLAMLLLTALVISAVHLIQFGVVVSGNVGSLYIFRLSAGRGSATEYAGLFAGGILLADPGAKKFATVIRFAMALLAISILLTLSRGLITDVIIFGVILAGVAIDKSGRMRLDLVKLFRLALICILSIAAIYLILTWTLSGVLKFISDEFITKLVNSLTEVSGSNLETRNQIADNYRAFELAHVMTSFESSSTLVQWFGQGWGSTLRFGFETAGSKSSFSRTEAPFLHNGYAYYLMKTGIVGLVLYMCFILHIITTAVSPRIWRGLSNVAAQRKVLLALALAMAADTVASGGLGFPASHMGAIFLVGMCCGPIWGMSETDSEGKTSVARRPTSSAGNACFEAGGLVAKEQSC